MTHSFYLEHFYLAEYFKLFILPSRYFLRNLVSRILFWDGKYLFLKRLEHLISSNQMDVQFYNSS